MIRTGVLLSLVLAGVAAPQAQDVVYAAHTLGYACFRIPAVVRTDSGALLAFAEGRVASCGDSGDIDLVLRRSTDGGHTWGPVQVVASGDGDTRGNPAPVVERDSGRIVLLGTYNPAEDNRDRRPFEQHSDDDGQTWSDPRELGAEVKPPEWNRWYATGPGHGVQLACGRLVIGGNYSSTTGSGAQLLYSDDGGDDWQLGAVDARPDNTVVPQEISVAELGDGRVYAAARNQNGANPEHRAAAVSSDGGESFDAPFATIPALIAPVVQGSVLYTGGTLLFSGPSDPDARARMAIRTSPDDGATWPDGAGGRVLNDGPAGYSDLVELDGGTIGLLYEAGERSPYESIRFARVGD